LQPLKFMRIFVLLALVTTILLRPGMNSINAATLDETIRIAIVKSAAEVTVSGEGLLVTDEAGSPLVMSLPARVKFLNNSLLVEGRRFKRLSFSAFSAVYVNNKPYRGLAELTVADKGILVVNQLPLEEYLVGLINCEISSAWPIEAVKAQAVIARTYALNKKKSRMLSTFHLESSVIDQVYEGSLVEDSRSRRAVSETEGEVLIFDGAIIQAFYHSSCGGRTEASQNIWGYSIPYLKGVECQYCQTSPTGTVWAYKLFLGEIEERLLSAGHKVSGLYDIRPGTSNSRGRLKQVILMTTKGNSTLSGEQFRKAIGYSSIKSTRFVTNNSNNEISFTGSGNGHGVGLCQWGAKQRALDGFGYGEILSYYYPGTQLKKLSDIR
jgi:stage II sporulation protein D